MKQLLIMRHGKAEQRWGIKDFDRELIPEGFDRTKACLSSLINENLYPQWIISSSAVRAASTARIIQEEGPGEVDLILTKDLYLCSVEELLNAAAECPSSVDRLMLVGHNPAMEYLTDRVIGHDCRVKTSEIRCFSTDIEHWAELNLGCLNYFSRIP